MQASRSLLLGTWFLYIFTQGLFPLLFYITASFVSELDTQFLSSVSYSRYAQTYLQYMILVQSMYRSQCGSYVKQRRAAMLAALQYTYLNVEFSLSVLFAQCSTSLSPLTCTSAAESWFDVRSLRLLAQK